MIKFTDLQGPILLAPKKSGPIGAAWNIAAVPLNIHYNVSSRAFIARGATQEIRSDIQILNDLQTYHESQTFMGSGYGLLL
jgi:hypothetical protein